MTGAMNLAVLVVYFLACWLLGLVYWMKGNPFEKALETALVGLGYGLVFTLALVASQFSAAIACGNHWSICSY